MSKAEIEKEIERLEHTNVGANEEVQSLLRSCNSTELKSGTTLAELIRRPELCYEDLKEIKEMEEEYNRLYN